MGRLHNDVQLGVNTAQNTIGCFFSSYLQRVLKSSEVNSENGSKIDFVYFGLNSNFIYNKLISPDSVQLYTFSPIPNAITTKIINKQESCNCNTAISVSQFDAMSNDVLLKSTAINQTNMGLAQFDNTNLPRVVLFQTNDGRKGAVKIKKFVDMGLQSYIICDIKVMKAF